MIIQVHTNTKGYMQCVTSYPPIGSDVADLLTTTRMLTPLNKFEGIEKLNCVSDIGLAAEVLLLTIHTIELGIRKFL